MELTKDKILLVALIAVAIVLVIGTVVVGQRYLKSRQPVGSTASTGVGNGQAAGTSGNSHNTISGDESGSTGNGDSGGVSADTGPKEGLNINLPEDFKIPVPNNSDDRDLDGLTNEQEAVAGTNPDEYDTDGDTYSDYAEVMVNKTDPLDAKSVPSSGRR